MTKNELLIKLEGLERDIYNRAYIEDWDGDDDEGRPIERLVFNEMTEEDTEQVLKTINNIINSIINNGIKESE